MALKTVAATVYMAQGDANVTILQTVAMASEHAANKAALGQFFKVARLSMQANGRRSEAEQLATITAATPRVQAIMKSAVSAGAVSSGIADYDNLVTAFYQSLRSASAFDAILPAMTPAPLRSRGTITTTGVSGGVVPEGQIKPISSVTLDNKLVEPRKAAAIVVISAELAAFSSPAAVALFNTELQKGVVAATDAVFLAELIANTTPTGSAGATLANIQTDLGALLDAVTTSANSRLFYVTTPANAKKLTMKAATSGAAAFPNMGPHVSSPVSCISSEPTSNSSCATIVLASTTISMTPRTGWEACHSSADSRPPRGQPTGVSGSSRLPASPPSSRRPYGHRDPRPPVQVETVTVNGRVRSPTPDLVLPPLTSELRIDYTARASPRR